MWGPTHPPCQLFIFLFAPKLRCFFLCLKKGAYFHEFGHQIDEELGFPFAKDKKLLKLLYEDYENILEKHRDTIVDLINTNDKANGVSDLVNGLSRGKLKGKYCHQEDYWKNEENFASEFFAHTFESQFDEERREIVEKYFKKSYNYITEKMKGYV